MANHQTQDRSRTFGGGSGIRVRSRLRDCYADRSRPVLIKGLLATDLPITLSDARNLHKQLGKALAHLDAEKKQAKKGNR